MSLHFFEGAAGTGKTFQLMKRLAVALEEHPLGERQKVLALSRMHGSRRRLIGRLADVPGLNRRFECATIDSFARHILLRWRSLASGMFGDAPPSTFEETCKRAGVLLALPSVSSWVARTFPMTVVDEIQDSKGEQLKIIQGLGFAADMLAAGDGFQDLADDGINEAMSWARGAGECLPLASVHRTSVSGLLAAAEALRAGSAVPKSAAGFEIVDLPKAPLGAWYAARFIAGRDKGDSVVLLSPAGPKRSPFVRELTERLAAGEIGKAAKFGPYTLTWERTDEDRASEAIKRIGITDRKDGDVVSAAELNLGDTTPERELSRWLDRQRKTRGIESFPAIALRDALSRIVQRLRVYRRSPGRFSAMTIHQAKNQEFDDVIVLWPYQVSGSDEKLRRLLYNAVTRAKKRVIVIVQNNAKKDDRLLKPPFVP